MHRVVEVCGALPWLVSEVMEWMVVQVALNAQQQRDVDVVVVDVARALHVKRLASVLRAQHARMYGADKEEDANEILRRIAMVRCASLAEVAASVLLLREQLEAEPQRSRVIFIHGLYNLYWESKHIAKLRQTAPLPQGRCLDVVAVLAQALSSMLRHKASKVAVVMSRYHMFGPSATSEDYASSFLRNQWTSLVTARLQVVEHRPAEFIISLLGEDEEQSRRPFRITANGIEW